MFNVYFFDGKAEFSALLPQSSVSHHPSEIIWIFSTKKVILIFSMVIIRHQGTLSFKSLGLVCFF